MSNRTAQANKAVTQAWENEQRLVSEGKGTRDWTPEQQRDILDKGKAYGANGRIFEGHHMKSVEGHPDFQGDPGNIQFLSRTEHKNAHGGSFQNPTNGYFDPITQITRDFGENDFETCDVIELSEPVTILSEKAQDVAENTAAGTSVNTDADRPHADSSTPPSIKSPAGGDVDLPGQQTRVNPSLAKRFAEGRVGGTLIRWGTKAWEHRDIIVPIVGSIVIPVVTEVIKGLTGGDSNRSHNDYSLPTTNNGRSSGTEADGTTIVLHAYPDERSSPIKHGVSGYDRQQNGKTVHVNSYKRGKGKDD